MQRERLVAARAGVLGAQQLPEMGMSEWTARRRVRAGRWREVLPRVYLLDGHRWTDEARVRAAWLWADGRCRAAGVGQPPRPGRTVDGRGVVGDRADSGRAAKGVGAVDGGDARGAAGPGPGAGMGAVICGSAAAYWHGMLDRAPRTVELCVPERIRLRAPAGVLVHRRELAVPDRVVRRGVAVTGPELTVLDTAVEHGSTFLDRALQRHVGLAAVQAAHRRRFGTRGNGAVRRLLAVAAVGGESEAERWLVALLRRAGITGWVLGHPFGAWTIDLAFPGLQIAVEVDGWAWHRDADRQRNDRRKGNAPARAGWVLLRIDWHDLVDDPDGVLALICSKIRATGPSRAGLLVPARLRGSCRELG